MTDREQPPGPRNTPGASGPGGSLCSVFPKGELQAGMWDAQPCRETGGPVSRLAEQNTPRGSSGKRPRKFCLVVVHLGNVDGTLGVTYQVTAEVIGHLPEEILVHVTKAVTLPGKDEHIKTFVGTDEGICNANCV